MAILTRDAWPRDGKKRSHIPKKPIWAAILRITQVVLSIVLLALTTWGLTSMQKATNYRRITSFSGTEGFPLSWFASAWTLTYLTWLGVAVISLPVMYNYWVHLGLEIFSVIIWLVCFALLASHADILDDLDAFILTFGPTYEAYYKLNVETFARAFVIATFASTAVATTMFLLFLTSAFAFARELHGYRQGKMRTTEEAVESDSVNRRKALDPSVSENNELGHRQQIPELQARQVLELQGRDPRYHTAELEDSRRRVELE